MTHFDPWSHFNLFSGRPWFQRKAFWRYPFPLLRGGAGRKLACPGLYLSSLGMVTCQKAASLDVICRAWSLCSWLPSLDPPRALHTAWGRRLGLAIPIPPSFHHTSLITRLNFMVGSSYTLAKCNFSGFFSGPTLPSSYTGEGLMFEHSLDGLALESAS